MLNSCYTLPAYFQTRVSESGAIKRLLNTLSTMCILNWMHWRKWAKMVPIKILMPKTTKTILQMRTRLFSRA